MAAETSDGEAFEYEAIVEEWFDGFFCVEIVEVLILELSVFSEQIGSIDSYLLSCDDNRDF